MLPKICYFLFYLFAALVGATPIDLEARAPTPPPTTPVPLGITKQTIKGGKGDFTEYTSIVRFKKGTKLTEEQIVGLAEAAWEEMLSDHTQKGKKKFNGNKIPRVMSALQVGDEVYLASSMKGGGGDSYIYTEKETQKVDEKKPKKADEKKPNGSGSKNVKDKKKQPQTPAPKTPVPEDEFAEFTNVLKNNAKDVMQALKEVSIDSKDHKKQKEQPAGKPYTLDQHRVSASCGEVMASLLYRLENKNKDLRKTKVDKQKPKIVAWSRVNQDGKLMEKGSIMNPCGSPSNTDAQNAAACGENWGCKAFTGPAGMDFDVIKKSVKAKPPNTQGFPAVDRSSNQDFPKLEKAKPKK
ncbi:hypothetical protein BDV26DRAFT_292541 [Aspergillus bertholletiae]|uniref:Uncharacterized protein n=1 Tax=Aspergillus bertholletiae TaxID=1226010 RepID=A0A5N7B8H8_9EURO|nr:hypothetical protein BDV26DRAFT_292541 [Aspergillus bertholletiae]